MNYVLLLIAAVLSLPAFAVVEEDPTFKPEAFGEQKGLFVEYFNYEDYVYSRSKKTELGDKVELDLGLRYQYDKDTFARLRFETDPSDNRFDNKTSKFELLAGHNSGTLFVQLDAELNTDETSTGGSSIGLDLDSELTLISYRMDPWDFRFYPFNFDGEVGREFNTWDVTRIYFIDGAPSTVNNTQLADEKIAAKTIPGFEIGYSFDLGSMPSYVYAGIGAATYLYPTNETFDIESARTADRWERKEDVAYKGGMRTFGKDFRLEIEYVAHTQAKETGSLLEAAGSIYNIFRAGGFLVENEVTYSSAGERPYRISRDGQWFEETTPFQPVYSDYYGNRQNWLGKEDVAYSLRVGLEKDNTVPYLAYKYQGKHFIFRDRESAHTLRTADETQSHGGLHRYGVGAFFYAGNFVINPEFEFLQANKPVFGNSSDVRQDRVLSSFEKEDYLLFLTVTYNFGVAKNFRP